MASATGHAVDIDQVILHELQEKGAIENSLMFAEIHQLSHNDVVGAIKSLECDYYVCSTVSSIVGWSLTEEGKKVAEEGSPEYRVFEFLHQHGSRMLLSAVEESFGKETTAIALSQGMKTKLFCSCKEGADVFLSIVSKPGGTLPIDDARKKCLSIQQGEALSIGKDLEVLKKRKLVLQETKKIFSVVKGSSFSVIRKKPVSDITREMLTSGTWKDVVFKPYNFTAKGRPPITGALHPLMKVRQEFREVFLELGFNEMETQNFVESCFWNFDALFVPQKHPARDLQDTFYLSVPAVSSYPNDPPAEYADAVKACHENGGDTGSLGYRCSWSKDESARNVLRTHTTAVTARLLYQIAQKSPIGPNGKRMVVGNQRYFSIDRVFRNEEMDKTHLCEFHQIEGFMLDEDLSLANMIHILKEFFEKIGIQRLRFKPAYNPYTEPSMEIFGYHEGFQKWVEVGNSGVFRPEMLRPMGFDENVTAVAWGLSLERPTMIKYGISNIHDLFGHKVDLGFIRRSPLCRMKR